MIFHFHFILQTKSNDALSITPLVLRQVAKIIGIYLWRTDIPPLLKECTFHMLAQTLRALYASESYLTASVKRIAPSPQLYLQLQTELYKLYDHEIKSSSTDFRFSSYFQALLEVVLAAFETTSSPIVSLIQSPSMSEEPFSKMSPDQPLFVHGMVGAAASIKIKKSKIKRDRTSSTLSQPSGAGASRRIRRTLG